MKQAKTEPNVLIAAMRAQQQRALDEQARLAAKVMCSKPQNPADIQAYHTALGVVRGISQAMALVESELLNF